jgi:uncharacterized membrane protein YdjX (TVP38/TMEM64 family)
VSPHDRRALLRLAALAVLVGALFAALALSGGLSSQRVHDALAGAGWAGPVAFVLVSAALTVALFPGPLLAGAAGLLFGTALGAPTAIVAATVGACAAFLVSRHVGARAVDQLVGHRVGRLQEWIAARGFLSVLYARILPLMPYTLVNYAAGLTRVRLVVFAGATALGCAPRAVAYTALGGHLNDLGSPTALAAFGVLTLMALGGIPFVWRDVRRSGSGTGSSSPDGRSAAPR